MSADAVPEKPQILVVDDSRVIRRAASKMLGEDYIVHEAEHGVDAWQQLQQNDGISVVFSDLQMPEMSGLELLAHIRQSDNDRLASLPVIMITGQSDTEAAKRTVFDAGATDFISKPFESIDLLSRAKSYARLNRKVVELEKRTGHDKLTGLNSAASFEEFGAKAISFAQRHHLNLTTVYFEIVEFQDIYLTHGKSVAQQILVAVSRRLQESLRTEDTAARIGVARFSVLLPMTSEVNARVVINRIRDNINKLVFSTGRDRIRVMMAAGFTAPEITDDSDFAGIMSQCDAALERALARDNGEKVAGFFDREELPLTVEVATEEDVAAAFEHILNGDYYQIPDYVLEAVTGRIAPFLDYVTSQSDTGRTGTTNSHYS